MFLYANGDTNFKGQTNSKIDKAISKKESNYIESKPGFICIKGPIVPHDGRFRLVATDYVDNQASITELKVITDMP